MGIPDVDALHAEAFARAALNALRTGAAEDESVDEPGAASANDPASAVSAEGSDAEMSDEEEAASDAPSAAGNLARDEAQRQREWLYRGYRRSRGGWNRD